MDIDPDEFDSRLSVEASIWAGIDRVSTLEYKLAVKPTGSTLNIPYSSLDSLFYRYQDAPPPQPEETSPQTEFLDEFVPKKIDAVVPAVRPLTVGRAPIVPRAV